MFHTVILLFCLIIPITVSAQINSSCGLEGSYKDRLQDCALLNGDLKEWRLVTRTSDGKSVFLNDAAGVIWGYPVNENFNHSNAELACKTGFKEFQHADFNWQIPSIEEIRTAETHGIRNVLQLEKHYYWSGSIHHADQTIVWLYDGTNGDVFLDLRSDDFYNVLCVSKIQ